MVDSIYNMVEDIIGGAITIEDALEEDPTKNLKKDNVMTGTEKKDGGPISTKLAFAHIFGYARVMKQVKPHSIVET